MLKDRLVLLLFMAISLQGQWVDRYVHSNALGSDGRLCSAVKSYTKRKASQARLRIMWHDAVREDGLNIPHINF